MPILSEPIYNKKVSLKPDEAIEKAKELSKKYKVKRIDIQKGEIVLNAKYKFRVLTYSTLIKEIVILIKSIAPNDSLITVFGKPTLSPHHIFYNLFRDIDFIDIDQFKFEVQNIFKKYEIINKNERRSQPTVGSMVIFWFMEIISVIAFFIFFLQVFNSQSIQFDYLIYFFIFLIFQIPLTIWLLRDCYKREFLSNSTKMKWISLIALTGFIGCLFYYHHIYKES